jgi:hypothetical protein
MGTLLMVKTLNYIELSNGYVVFMMNLTGNVGLYRTAIDHATALVPAGHPCKCVFFVVVAA